MANYIMQCASGTVVLVSASSAAEAEEQWDAEVDAGNAEERFGGEPGQASKATRADVRGCVENGHDYR